MHNTSPGSSQRSVMERVGGAEGADLARQLLLWPVGRTSQAPSVHERQHADMISAVGYTTDATPS